MSEMIDIEAIRTRNEGYRRIIAEGHYEGCGCELCATTKHLIPADIDTLLAEVERLNGGEMYGDLGRIRLSLEITDRKCRDDGFTPGPDHPITVARALLAEVERLRGVISEQQDRNLQLSLKAYPPNRFGG